MLYHRKNKFPTLINFDCSILKYPPAIYSHDSLKSANFVTCFISRCTIIDSEHSLENSAELAPQLHKSLKECLGTSSCKAQTVSNLMLLNSSSLRRTSEKTTPAILWDAPHYRCGWDPWATEGIGQTSRALAPELSG